ncbi:hypothetical protein VaNZ11_013046, partial [Volvox africanus]
GPHATTRSWVTSGLEEAAEAAAEAAAREHLNGAGVYDGVSPRCTTQTRGDAVPSGIRTAEAITASPREIRETRDSVGIIGGVDVLRSDESEDGTCSDSGGEDIDVVVTQMALRFQGH